MLTILKGRNILVMEFSECREFLNHNLIGLEMYIG